MEFFAPYNPAIAEADSIVAAERALIGAWP